MVLTEGVVFQFNQRCYFQAGVAVPVTGPNPYNIEALAQVNIVF